MDGRHLKLVYPIFIMVVLLLLQINPSQSLEFSFSSGVGHADANLIRCRERERQALLAFKQGLVDFDNQLSSWGTEGQKQDCCKWKGVFCSNRTGHVIKLDLGEQYLQGMMSPKLFELQHLKYLNLSYNNFNWTQIPDLIGSLSNLRYLDLSYSIFGGQIPYQLGNLDHLQYLNLSYNDFSHVPNLNWLPHLSSLKYLDLSFVELSNVSDWLQTISNLPNLRNLTLGACDLPPPIFSTLSHLNYSQSLARVDLSYNYAHVTSSIFKWLCNYNTSLVYLDLSSTKLSGSIPDVFQNMSSLVHLDLSNNKLGGGIPLSFAKLCSLESLRLSNSNLSGQFSQFVQVLSACRNSSERLSLSRNNLSAPFPNFPKFSSLKQLFLTGNQLSGRIPESIEQMSSLEVLSLSENQLSGIIPKCIGQMSSLKELSLSRNQLSGRILESIGQMSSLKQLDLSENRLNGRIPESIGQLSSLTQLILSGNQLSGIVPQSIGKLSKLEALSLGMNSLEGVISETHFSKLSKLQVLDLSSNSLVFNVHSGWVPPFQLNYIILGSCKMGPYFPKWLRTQKNSLYLDISDAGISDFLPSWFWGLCSKLFFMNLSHNQIRGTLANTTLEFDDFPEVHLSSNQFEGPIPSILSKSSYLDLSNNKISGSISFLYASAAGSLTFLNLSGNHVSGELPDCWTPLENLVMLDLSNNDLSGKIPTTIGSLIRIETLKLRSNKFVGELPSSLKNCTSLKVMDLGENEFSRAIPEWLGASLPNLVILLLQSNHFSGSLPSQLCHLTRIQILDLSVNNISGSIPKCLNNLTTLAQKGNSTPTITHSYTRSIDGNYKYPISPIDNNEDDLASPFDNYEDDATFIWKGRMYAYKNTLGLVKRVDLSSNRLTGEVPSEITHLVGLVSLNLSRNHLEGKIPPEIGKLQSLDSLDLSRNQIDGRIPTSLSRIDRLSSLDLSYNNLSGEIPIGTQLQGFDPSVYAGNPQLCGLPLQKMCAPEPTSPNQTVFRNQEDKDELITQGFYISMGVGFVVGFWGVCGSLIFIRSWRYTYLKFLNVLNDWIYVRAALIRRKLRDA